MVLNIFNLTFNNLDVQVSFPDLFKLTSKISQNVILIAEFVTCASAPKLTIYVNYTRASI